MGIQVAPSITARFLREALMISKAPSLDAVRSAKGSRIAKTTPAAESA